MRALPLFQFEDSDGDQENFWTFGWRRKADLKLHQTLSKACTVCIRAIIEELLLSGVLVHTSEKEIVQVEVLHDHRAQTPPKGTRGRLFFFVCVCVHQR